MRGPGRGTTDRIEDPEPLFEGATAFLVRLAAANLPRDDPERYFAGARAIAHSMPEADQVELIDSHPRLGAPPGTVSVLSFREQGYDHTPVGDLSATLERLNDAYEARFGFRYCVFVAGRSRPDLLPGFEAALGATDRDAERHRALDAVIDIAADRHGRLAGPPKESPR